MESLNTDKDGLDAVKNLPHKWFEDMIHYLEHGHRHNETTIDFREPQLRYSFVTLYPLFMFLYSLIVVIGLFSNCIMVYVIFRDGLYKDQTFCYFINLALGDIVKCVFVLPISLMVLLIQNWIFGSLLCYFLPMMQNLLLSQRERKVQMRISPMASMYLCILLPIVLYSYLNPHKASFEHGSLLAGLYHPVQPTAQQKPNLNLGNLIDVQERHITNRKCRDSGIHGQFDRSSLLWEMTVGRFLLASKRVCHPPPSSEMERLVQSWPPLLPERHDFEMRPLLPNFTHPEYPVTPEAAQRFLQD
ncbi:hypothetical protein J6590_015507 [Homalodisca vitripennis]|nr:hypothetical protein J6590_015507 [Homalodisca vitripennis]